MTTDPGSGAAPIAGAAPEAWVPSEIELARRALRRRMDRRRIVIGGLPNACENARENAAALEKPVRAAISVMGTPVSSTSLRAALSLRRR